MKTESRKMQDCGVCGWWGALGTQQHKLSFCQKYAKICQFSIWPNPPTSHRRHNLAFFCFLSSCDAIYSSFKSPSGPMVSISEHLCLPKNTLYKILESSLNIKNTKTQRCLCLKTFPVFPLFIFNN